MDFNNLLKILKNNDYYYFMGNYIENDTDEYFSLFNNYEKQFLTLIFRDKASGKLKGGNEILLDDTIPLFCPPLVGYKDEFIGVLSSVSVQNYLLSIKKENKKSIFPENINEDSNPILISYKLKHID